MNLATQVPQHGECQQFCHCINNCPSIVGIEGLKGKVQTYSNATPATPEARQAITAAAALGANLATSAGREVSLYPVVHIHSRSAKGVSSTLLAVVEGVLLAVVVAVELAN